MHVHQNDKRTNLFYSNQIARDSDRYWTFMALSFAFKSLCILEDREHFPMCHPPTSLLRVVFLWIGFPVCSWDLVVVCIWVNSPAPSIRAKSLSLFLSIFNRWRSRFDQVSTSRFIVLWLQWFLPQNFRKDSLKACLKLIVSTSIDFWMVRCLRSSSAFALLDNWKARSERRVLGLTFETPCWKVELRMADWRANF